MSAEKLEPAFDPLTALMRMVLRNHPEASVILTLHYLNDSHNIQAAVIYGGGGAVSTQVDLSKMFPVLKDWVRAHSHGKGIISCRAFIKDGEKIAALLRRELTILHLRTVHSKGKRKVYKFPRMATRQHPLLTRVRRWFSWR